MRKLLALAIIAGLSAPAAAQPATDAALGRIADALRDEANGMYVAGLIRSCGLRSPAWVERLITVNYRLTGDIFEAEKARLPADQRAGFEREAWRMQAQTRAYTNHLATNTRGTAIQCAEARRETEAFATMDQAVGGRH